MEIQKLGGGGIRKCRRRRNNEFYEGVSFAVGNFLKNLHSSLNEKRGSGEGGLIAPALKREKEREGERERASRLLIVLLVYENGIGLRMGLLDEREILCKGVGPGI